MLASVYTLGFSRLLINYKGIHVCFNSPFEYLPKEAVLRDEFACMVVRAMKEGTTNALTGSSEIYSDIGASRFQSNINTLIYFQCNTLTVDIHFRYILEPIELLTPP